MGSRNRQKFGLWVKLAECLLHGRHTHTLPWSTTHSGRELWRLRQTHPTVQLWVRPTVDQRSPATIILTPLPGFRERSHLPPLEHCCNVRSSTLTSGPNPGHHRDCLRLSCQDDRTHPACWGRFCGGFILGVLTGTVFILAQGSWSAD